MESGEFVTDDVEFDKEDHDDDSIEGDDGPDRRILNEDGKGGSTLDVAVFNLVGERVGRIAGRLCGMSKCWL